jgi:cytochrome d ubiquinol oxidase subunit I
VATTLILFVLVYGVVFSFGIYFINRLIAGGIREPALPEQTPKLAVGHTTHHA